MIKRQDEEEEAQTKVNADTFLRFVIEVVPDEHIPAAKVKTEQDRKQKKDFNAEHMQVKSKNVVTRELYEHIIQSFLVWKKCNFFFGPLSFLWPRVASAQNFFFFFKLELTVSYSMCVCSMLTSGPQFCRAPTKHL